MTEEKLASELYSRYGTVTRARECFLYTKKGERLTDLYQQNGRAILGWGGKEAFTQLKNTLNRGITGAFITEDKSRLDKAVSALLNSPRKTYIFQSQKAAEAFASKASKTIKCWMPWSPEQIKWEEEKCVVIAPPLPWTENFYLAALLTQNSAEVKEEPLEDGQIKLAEPLVVAITRNLYDMIAALQVREEKNWFLYDKVLTKYFTRKGPYLYSKLPENKYDDFVLHCLDCGIIINPDFAKPSIVPFGADKGVFSKLKKAEFL